MEEQRREIAEQFPHMNREEQDTEDDTTISSMEFDHDNENVSN